MKQTHIGRHDHGVDGHDFYYRVDLQDEDRAAIQIQGEPAQVWLLEQLLDAHGFDSTAPGHLFCNHVTVMPFPHNEDSFVAIVHVQRDV